MANCVHGFPQSECLICRTLGVSSGQPGSTKTKTKTRGASSNEISGLLSPGPGVPLPATRQDDLSDRRRRGGRSPIWPLLGVIVVGGVLLWIFSGVVSLAFHIAEYVAVGLIAGWVGYKLGHHRGRRGA